MDGLNAVAAWVGENETLLSGVAAIVVVLSIVVSPLGAGLRGLVRRWALSSSGIIETSVAAVPPADIPEPPELEANRPSIAVLPFVPVSDDKDSEIFADGMTNDIITALGHVPGFFVTSGNSTFVYKGQSVDTRQIGRELGVRYVVEGRVQRAGNDIRINVTLVEAGTGNQIWSAQFSGDLSDIFTLQDDVTRSIVGQLQPELMQAEWRRGGDTPTENLDAWTLLHSAQLKYVVAHSRAALDEAVRLTEAALDKDPGYADAHGFLTFMIVDRMAARWSDNLESDNDRAADHCRKALDLDPENPIVLNGAAVFNLFIVGNPDTAVEQIELSCAINPNDAFAQAVRGFTLACAGRGEQGLEAVDLALRLSPRDPRTFFFVGFKAFVHITLEQYEEAEQLCRRSFGLKEGYFWARLYYTIALAMQGKADEAVPAVQELKLVAPGLNLDDLEHMLGTWQGNPMGERATLIDKWIDSLRDIWPS